MPARSPSAPGKFGPERRRQYALHRADHARRCAALAAGCGCRGRAAVPRGAAGRTRHGRAVERGRAAAGRRVEVADDTGGLHPARGSRARSGRPPPLQGGQVSRREAAEPPIPRDPADKPSVSGPVTASRGPGWCPGTTPSAPRAPAYRSTARPRSFGPVAPPGFKPGAWGAAASHRRREASERPVVPARRLSPRRTGALRSCSRSIAALRRCSTRSQRRYTSSSSKPK